MRFAGHVSIAAVLGLAAACGSGSSSSNEAKGTDGGATDAAAPVATHDAASEKPPVAADTGTGGSPTDGPWVPADHYPMPMMQDFGGTVLSAPRVVTVTFVGDASRDAERSFDDEIVQSAWWTVVTDGWNIGKGTGGTYAELPDTVSGKTLDDEKDLQPMIAQWLASGALPAPDANTLYAIYFPASTTLTLQGGASCSKGKGSFGGYHNSASMVLRDGGASLVDGGGTDVAYAVLPGCADTVAVSHELIEAATDPHPGDRLTWYGYQDAWWGAGGGEVGDACENRGPVMDSSGNQVTRAWVNSAAKASRDGCQPEAPGEVFFAAAVPTDTVKNIVDPTGGPNYDSEGYMLVARGATRTVDVVVFSEGPLPNELQLFAGSRANNNMDPTQLDPLPGVTLALSAATGHNGTHVTLTVNVAAGATPGDTEFVVRAVLNANDYHSWPVLLRVQ